MKRRFGMVAVLAATAILGGVPQASAQYFLPIKSVSSSTQDTDLWPASNLIQGPGIGFEEDAPYDKILDGAEGNWVTDACGFPCSYVDNLGTPILTFDLGEDRLLKEISVWGYSISNSNGMSEFSLRFATDMDGPDGFGNTIAYEPYFEDVDIDNFIRQSFPFAEDVTARYVELTALYNYFEEPGDGSNGEIPGGDRMGIGEIAFETNLVIEPPAPDVTWYDIDYIEASTIDFDLYPADNLIQGPGVGFANFEPYNRISGGADGTWVTEACGFPCDYLDTFDPPELLIDLGEDVPLNQIDVWGYADTNSNGVREFSLSFATEEDGEDGFGTSIDYEPTFEDVDISATVRQEFPFDRTVTARYVRFTALDNYFEEPGDGSGENGWPAGGDRVGLGEIAFPIPGDNVPGDFNGDGVLDLVDINLLNEAVAGGTDPPAFDVTGDGLVNTADVTFWAEDLKNTWVGDSNLDGEFNSRDFVEIFQAGKFESGNPAKWEEGDWTGDLLFDSSDFVAAFQSGGFEMGPKAAVSAVPEPAGLTLLLGGLLFGCGWRRRR